MNIKKKNIKKKESGYYINIVLIIYKVTKNTFLEYLKVYA
jgi:hypothetical protein